MLVLRVGNATFCRSGNATVLQHQGIRSEQAASGREALEFLRLYDYDLVLMDLQLPDLPAYEVVRMMLSSGLQFSPKVGFENSLIGVPFGSFDRG